MKKRSEFPSYARLVGMNFDHSRLVNFCEEHGLFQYEKFNDLNLKYCQEFKGFIVENSFNRAFLMTDQERAKSTESFDDYYNGEEYKQLYATTFNEEALRDRDVVFSKNPLSMKERLSRLNPSSENYSPYADERNYNKRKPIVTGYLEELLNSFKGPVTRVRFAAMNPGFKLVPHIDYDTDYIVRFHFPIITNSKSGFVTWRKGQKDVCHFPCDGGIYFINTGYKHTAFNYGESVRLHLIVDVAGQQDIDSNGLQEYYSPFEETPEYLSIK